MRGRKNKKPPAICVDRDRGSGDRHEVRVCRHGHGRGRLSKEGTKRYLTDDNMDGKIGYCRNRSGRGDTLSMTTSAATPLTAPTTNGIDGSTE